MTTFESVYKPARQGRKVAYLTLASFIFLLLALGLVLAGEHASQPSRPKSVSRIELNPLSFPSDMQFSSDLAVGGRS